MTFIRGKSMSKVTVITGNGKGKTTAALGLIIEAAEKGQKVYLGQFMKGGSYSEIKGLKAKYSDNTVIEQYAGFRSFWAVKEWVTWTIKRTHCIIYRCLNKIWKK
jgi:ATP:corrinoid adenosyltransferase